MACDFTQLCITNFYNSDPLHVPSISVKSILQPSWFSLRLFGSNGHLDICNLNRFATCSGARRGLGLPEKQMHCNYIWLFILASMAGFYDDS